MVFPNDGLPTLFLLHFLGGSTRTWAPVASRLGDVAHCVAIDLPGFGDAVAVDGRTVEQMAAYVAARIVAEGAASWALAGHSMGAKVAAAVARRAEDGAPGLEGLRRVILVAGSPPAPEPMAEERRAAMLAWFQGDVQTSRAEAEQFVGDASGPLDHADRERAVDDVLRADKLAFRAWLQHGSREDWRDRIGLLNTPALIVAGSDDADLGPDSQRRLMAPHFAHPTLAVIHGAKHLLPLERPGELAGLIRAHLV